MHHHVNKMGCCLQCHSEGLQKDIIKIWLFLLYHLKYSFAAKHSMIVGHQKPKCLVKILECCVHGHGHSKCSNFQLFVKIASEQWTAQPFVTKLGVATHHCMLLSTRSRSQWGLMRRAYKFIHSTYYCLYYIFWTNDSFATKLSVVVDIINWNVQWKYWVALFKVTVTPNVHNFSWCLFKWYFMNCWTFHNQIWYGDTYS